MKRNRYLIGLLSLIFCSTISLKAQDMEYSADLNVVSTYVWRGVKQFDGIAMQGSFGAGYRAISFGLWYSSVNFGADTPFFETDPFIEVVLPTGPVSSALGASMYSYDFSEFNAEADFEYELYVKAGVPLFEIGAYYLPNQGSLKNEIIDSAYWLSFSAAKTVQALDVGLMFETGTYSSRFLMTPKADAVHLLSVRAAKSLTDLFAVSWHYSYGISSELDNTLWMSLGMVY